MLASARLLAGPDRLRVSREEAAATLFVLYSPQVAGMLMGDHGWSPQRYERWWRGCSWTPSSGDGHVLSRLILGSAVGSSWGRFPGVAERISSGHP